MDVKHCLFLGIVLCLTAISESRVIVPRALSEDKIFVEEVTAILKPVEAGRPRRHLVKDYDDYDDDDDYTGIDPVRRPSNKDYKPDRGVNEKDDNLPGIKPERFPSDSEYDEWSEEKPKKEDDADKSGDENIKKPLDEEDIDKYGDDDKDFEPPSEKDRPIYKGTDESEVKDTDLESEEDSKDKEHEVKDDEKSDERNQEEEVKFKPEKDDEDEDIPEKEKDEPESIDEKEDIPEEEKDEPESIDEKEDIPEEEKDEPESDDEKKQEEEEPTDHDNKEEDIPKEVEEETFDNKDDRNNGEIIPPNGEAGFFSSIFDTPFFNLEQVKKYFSKLERALGHVFRQTMDEALLLNGTYANTTEEEVDIGGKKYIVTKSVIKGGDNHSSMYIEALSAKPRMNESKMMKDVEIKNMTFI